MTPLEEKLKAILNRFYRDTEYNNDQARSDIKAAFREIVPEEATNYKGMSPDYLDGLNACRSEILKQLE
jgi:hypothetical protein